MKKVTYKLDVTSCGFCPNQKPAQFKDNGGDFWICMKSGMVIDSGFLGIPEWCPLDDPIYKHEVLRIECPKCYGAIYVTNQGCLEFLSCESVSIKHDCNGMRIHCNCDELEVK
jgi:hypothetical protein